MWFWRAQRYIFFMFYKEKDCDPIRTHTLNLYIFDKFSRLFIFGAVLNPDSAIEPIRMNLIQAFSPLTKIWAWIPHPYGMGLKYIWLSALSGNGYVQGTRCPNANFANERSTHRRDAMICVSTTCTPVIPNAVRNPARKRKDSSLTL